MEQGFYKDRLSENFGLRVITPNATDRKVVHNIIYKELILGVTRPQSKQQYLRIIESLACQGAQAVILGCTEIGMLVSQTDTKVTLLDTTLIHAQKAVEFAVP